MNRTFAALGLAATLLGGCAARNKSMNAAMTPPSGEQVDAIRASYKTAFPNATVGVVTAVLANRPYALVGQMESGTVQENQIVTFLDAQQKVIANGQVMKVDENGATVMFDAGARRPMVGDLAVRF